MNKKMILAILEETNSNAVQSALYDAGYPLSIIDTSGGLLFRGSRTLILGVDDNEVDRVITLINQHCAATANPFKERATIMVFNLEHFEQIP
jgi:uncharacterized protein YaaQ